MAKSKFFIATKNAEAKNNRNTNIVEEQYSQYHQRKEYDEFIKIRIDGDSGVGKSCLLLRYVDDTYTESYISTIGVDFKIKNLTIDGKVIKVQIWDTAGQKSFRKINCNYPNVQAHIIVFDLTDQESFSNVKKWIAECQKYGAESAKIILVGAKSDSISKRVINKKVIKKYIENEECIEGYIETSAKTSENIDKVFDTTVRLVLNAQVEKHKVITQQDPNTQEVLKKLDAYIKRIEGYKNNFQKGFWFFSESRAINREANYLLAKKLKNSLEEKPLNKLSVFSQNNITDDRNSIIKENNLFCRKDYTHRGLKSSELNKIIKLANPSYK